MQFHKTQKIICSVFLAMFNAITHSALLQHPRAVEQENKTTWNALKSSNAYRLIHESLAQTIGVKDVWNIVLKYIDTNDYCLIEQAKIKHIVMIGGRATTANAELISKQEGCPATFHTFEEQNKYIPYYVSSYTKTLFILSSISRTIMHDAENSTTNELNYGITEPQLSPRGTYLLFNLQNKSCAIYYFAKSVAKKLCSDNFQHNPTAFQIGLFVEKSMGFSAETSDSITIYGSRFTHDDKFLAINNSQGINIWSLQEDTIQYLRRIPYFSMEHEYQYLDMDINSNNDVVTFLRKPHGMAYGIAMLHDPFNNQSAKPQLLKLGSFSSNLTQDVLRVSFAPDGKTFVVGNIYNVAHICAINENKAGIIRSIKKRPYDKEDTFPYDKTLSLKKGPKDTSSYYRPLSLDSILLSNEGTVAGLTRLKDGDRTFISILDTIQENIADTEIRQGDVSEYLALTRITSPHTYLTIYRSYPEPHRSFHDSSHYDDKGFIKICFFGVS